MIDLHTHTTASDGRCTPADLVSRAHERGVTTLSVTDHDTVAGCAAAARACDAAGIIFVPGIEITGIADGTDVHILGYFMNTASAALEAFLAEQRVRRIDRVREIVARLAAHGIALDGEAIVRPAVENPASAVGRPAVARALIEARIVADTREAFDAWLSRGRPGFVPRMGPTPAQVFDQVHRAGGIVSLAHPGLLARDGWIPEFVQADLDAIEVYHSKHDATATARYLGIARQHRLLMSGGSDFHGDDAHGPSGPGAVTLPKDAFDALAAGVRRWR